MYVCLHKLTNTVDLSRFHNIKNKHPLKFRVPWTPTYIVHTYNWHKFHQVAPQMNEYKVQRICHWANDVTVSTTFTWFNLWPNYPYNQPFLLYVTISPFHPLLSATGRWRCPIKQPPVRVVKWRGSWNVALYPVKFIVIHLASNFTHPHPLLGTLLSLAATCCELLFVLAGVCTWSIPGFTSPVVRQLNTPCAVEQSYDDQ